MGKSERFDSLDAVHLHRDALRAKRVGHSTAVRSHWSTLGDAQFRTALVNGAVRGVWNAWRPMDTLRAVTGQPADLAGTLLGIALGSKARTGWGRVLMYVAGAAMPLLIERMKDNDRVQHLLSELDRSWHRIKDRMRERREAH
jgi:hypothetical protein